MIRAETRLPSQQRYWSTERIAQILRLGVWKQGTHAQSLRYPYNLLLVVYAGHLMASERVANLQ